MSHQLVTSIEMLSLGKLRIHGNPSICNPLLNECGNPDALILGIGWWLMAFTDQRYL